MFLRAQYNYSQDEVSEETGLTCKDPSLADQSQRDEVDINTVIARFGLTGHLPENNALPMYAEFDRNFTRQEVANELIEAQQKYDAMPAAVRHLCGKTFSQFLQFVDNPENADKVYELGLAVRQEPEKPIDNAGGNS